MKVSHILIALVFILGLSRAQALEIKLEKEPKLVKPERRLSGPVVLDARASFEYSVQHGIFSLPIRWQDFAQTEEPHKGELDPDAGFLARRLRVFGIMPNRKVIVVGKGQKGLGEEGRIAWMLKYLGVQNIEVISFESDKTKKASGEPPEVDAAPVWLPKVCESLRARVTEVEKEVNAEKTSTGNEREGLLIDVRESNSFSLSHIPTALNIPWTEFLEANGSPKDKSKVSIMLEKLGINRAGRTIFYSENGVASAYACFLASEAGFNSGNYDGGFIDWKSDSKRRLTAKP